MAGLAAPSIFIRNDIQTQITPTCWGCQNVYATSYNYLSLSELVRHPAVILAYKSRICVDQKRWPSIVGQRVVLYVKSGSHCSRYRNEPWTRLQAFYQHFSMFYTFPSIRRTGWNRRALCAPAYNWPSPKTPTFYCYYVVLLVSSITPQLLAAKRRNIILANIPQQYNQYQYLGSNISVLGPRSSDCVQRALIILGQWNPHWGFRALAVHGHRRLAPMALF